MFLWHTGVKNRDAQLIVRDRDSQNTLWVQKVNIGDKKVFYQGQPLQLSKIYQWKLEWQQKEATFSTPWANFQIMPANKRAQIQADLQRLEQKSLSANSEEIAIKKAEYFLNYLIKVESKDYLFSDGLQALYQVEKPSASFVSKREEFVRNICTPNQELGIGVGALGMGDWAWGRDGETREQDAPTTFPKKITDVKKPQRALRK
ncbi:MAG: hypothetical protein AAF630_03980 [Cyanobacteria bacterium P01_C01_bin.38]